MTEERKSTYKGSTEAMRKAIRKYQTEKVEDIRIRVPKGRKANIQTHAAEQGESMNQFVIRAIDEAMQRDVRKESVS